MPSLSCRRAFVLAWIAVSTVAPARGGGSSSDRDGSESARAELAQAVPDGLSTSDWSSIRAAYQAARHEVRGADDGHRARNPGQQWVAHFDGRGFTVVPDEGEWSWGLELTSFGFEGARQSVESPEGTRVQGVRLSYRWDDVVEEWYRNGASGLEHGFTIHERPARSDRTLGPLELRLIVRGGLQAAVREGGRDVDFLGSGSTTVVTYTGLCAFDADGRDLDARLEAAGSELRLLVEEAGARYPLTIDPTAQQGYLKASNTDSADRFGHSIAVSGNTVVIGAPFEDSSATGVNGNQASNSASNSGAAYVFVRHMLFRTWSQQAYLKATNTGAGDEFGRFVAISGDTVVVGAPNEDSSATGVNGNEHNDDAPSSGAAYVYVRSGTTWSWQAYLKASNTETGDSFGSCASISGDTVVVAADGEDSSATGVNGNQASNAAADSGAAYAFVRNGTTWSQQAYVKASNTGAGDRFGSELSVSADSLVVGAVQEDSSATGVNGNQADNSASGAGAAYVFTRAGSVWSQQAYIKATNTDADDGFGISVSISGDTVLVGAAAEDGGAAGVGGDQSDDSAPNAGAAYVYARAGSTWSPQAYLKASNPDADDVFGISVAISQDTAVVGASAEDSSATGVGGDQDDDAAAEAGAAYVFARARTVWFQTDYLKASNTDAGDRFGDAVAAAGEIVVIGAVGEDSSAVGVDGDQSDDTASQAGAAYSFERSFPALPGTALCFGDGSGAPCGCGNEAALGSGGGCANSAPMPAGQGAVLFAVGSTSVSLDELRLTADFSTNQPGLFFQGNNAIAGGAGATFGDGIRCCGGGVVRLEIADPPGAAGPKTVSTSLPILGTSPPGTTAAGDTRCYQWWYRNPGTSPCGFGFNLSNARLVTWSP